MNRLTCLSALLLVAALPVSPVWAQAPAAKLVSGQSEVSFVTRQMGVPVDGRFTKFDAQIQLDPRKPETGSVVVNVDTASATLGEAQTDAELPKAVWFNVVKFPQASFKSSSLKSLGGGRFEAAGKLQIKDRTRDLVVPVQIVQSGAQSTASGSFVIKRLDFGIGEGEWADTSVLANDVTVKFKLALSGLGPL